MKRVATTQRVGAALVIATGLVSFFVPLITTTPSVMGKRQWSLFDVIWQLQLGSLQGSAADLIVPGVAFGLPYLLMLLAMVCLWVFPDADFLARVGIAGAIVASLIFRFGNMDLEVIFYGKCCSFPIPVRPWGLTSLLLVVMVMLALLARAGASIQPGKQRPRWRLKTVKQEISEDEH